VRGGPNEGSNVRALVEDVVTGWMVVNDGVEVVNGKGRKKGDQKGQGKRWGWKDGSTLYQIPRGRSEK
jgi:hypothetical protein